MASTAKKYAKMTADERAEERLLKDMRSEFLADWRADKVWRKEKTKAEDFYDGDQWTDEELEELKRRGQPEVTANRIKPKVDAISGMQMAMRVDTKAFPKGLRDFSKANHISAVLKHVEQTNDFDDLENDEFENQVKSGRGWYSVRLEFDEDLQPEIIVESEDNDEITPDRHGKKADLSDSRRIHKHVMSDCEDVKKLFPDKKKKLQTVFIRPNFDSEMDEPHRRKRPDQYKGAPEDFGYSDFVDEKSKMIRVVTTQYRESYAQWFVVQPGQLPEQVKSFKEAHKIKAEFPDVEIFSQLRYRLNSLTYTWNCILEHKEDIAPWDPKGTFWFIKVPGYRRKKDGLDYGLIRQLLSPQKEYNKRRSKSLHLFSTNQIVREAGIEPEGEEGMLREEANKPDGEMIVPTGARFELLRNTEMGQAQFQLLNQTSLELEQAGVPKEIEGLSEANSGKEFQLRQQTAVAGIRRLFRNLRGARRRLFLLVMKFAQRYYTAELAVKVSDDPEAAPIFLNQPIVDEATGEVIGVANNVADGKFDLIVEEAPEYINLESETFAQLSQLALKGFPVDPEMLIEVAPVPNREKWLNQIRAQKQAAAQAAQLAQAQGAQPQQVLQ
jgi:hypothetical protein